MVGNDIGLNVGVLVGFDVGLNVGFDVGLNVGLDVGLNVGFDVGLNVGVLVGFDVGVIEGVSVESVVGTLVGSIVGTKIALGHCRSGVLQSLPKQDENELYKSGLSAMVDISIEMRLFGNELYIGYTLSTILPWEAQVASSVSMHLTHNLKHWKSDCMYSGWNTEITSSPMSI